MISHFEIDILIQEGSHFSIELQNFTVPIVFLAISGSHLYGTSSPDSDFDLHGVYVLPADNKSGLFPGPDFTKRENNASSVKVEMALHDIGKWCHLLLGHRGNILEDLYGTYILYNHPNFRELKSLVRPCITQGFVNHYRGFAISENKKWTKSRSVKQVLHTYRLLLTGITLMQEERVITRFIDFYSRFPHLESLFTDLIQRKQEAREALLDEQEVGFHAEYITALFEKLDDAAERSTLPLVISEQAKRDLSDFVVRIRYVASE